MPVPRHCRAAWCAPLLALLVTACGGGGDAAEASTATEGTAATAPEPVSATTTDPITDSSGGSSPAPSGGTGSGNVCGIADFQAQVMAAINTYRATGRSCGSKGSFGPAAALGWNALLAQAATAHSQDMAAQNYFSHTSADGRTFVNRIDAAGYAWQRLAENIAAGQSTVQEVVAGWIASDGHCANVMAPALTEVAVACVPGTSTSTYSRYWTMDMGTPR